MLKRLAVLGTILAVALAGTAVAVAGSQGGGKWGGKQATLSGEKCAKAGVNFLIENDLILAASRGEVDYDAIDSDTAPFTSGAINTNLPAGSFLPLGAVVELHLTNPELFDWCIKSKKNRWNDDDDRDDD
jgi:hypothetical protein